MPEIRVITLRITPHEHEAIREAAHKERTSINAWLTRIVRQELDLPEILGPVYKCPKCDSTFERIENYEEHYVVAHGGDANGDAGSDSDVPAMQQASNPR